MKEQEKQCLNRKPWVKGSSGQSVRPSPLVFQAVHLVASCPLCPTVWGHQPPDLLAATQIFEPPFLPSCPFSPHSFLLQSFWLPFSLDQILLVFQGPGQSHLLHEVCLDISAGSNTGCSLYLSRHCMCWPGSLLLPALDLRARLIWSFPVSSIGKDGELPQGPEEVCAPLPQLLRALGNSLSEKYM